MPSIGIRAKVDAFGMSDSALQHRREILYSASFSALQIVPVRLTRLVGASCCTDHGALNQSQDADNAHKHRNLRSCHLQPSDPQLMSRCLIQSPSFIVRAMPSTCQNKTKNHKSTPAPSGKRLKPAEVRLTYSALLFRVTLTFGARRPSYSRDQTTRNLVASFINAGRNGLGLISFDVFRLAHWTGLLFTPE